MPDARKYEEIFDYLSAEELPQSEWPLVVFGRDDVRVGWAAGELIVAGLAEVVVILPAALAKIQENCLTTATVQRLIIWMVW
jgi:hypothetical protein